MTIGAGTQERRVGAAGRAGRETLERRGDLGFSQRRRNGYGAAQGNRFGHRDERVKRFGTDNIEHRFDIAGRMRCVNLFTLRQK